jgi:hypothetical protein
MMEQKRLRGVRSGARCDHNYPVVVDVYDGGHRARCLRCQAVGPVRGDAHTARRVLLEQERGTY